MRFKPFFLALSAFSLLQAEEPLSERLLSPVAEIREDAAVELGKLPREVQEQFVPMLMVGLSSEDSDIHAQAATLLKKLRKSDAPTPDAPPPMSDETRGQIEKMRKKQLTEIHAVSGTDKYKDLTKTLAAEKRAQAQWSGNSEHPTSGASTAAAMLLESLNDSDPLVRSRAARRLGSLHPIPDEAIGPLTGLLGDPDKECRASAAATLGAIGPAARTALPDLRPLLSDADANVRAIAQDAVRQIQGQ